MKPLSARALGIRPSPTVSMDARYKRLLAEGRPVLSLGAGEPDLPFPEEGREALLRALREGKTRYDHMAGLPELRAALSRKFAEENGLDFGPDEILVTSGAKQAVYLALAALLDPGDEVLIPSPYWVTYPEAVRLLGGVPVEIPTRLEQGFKLTPEDLRRAAAPQSKLLILNSPCNPTGAAYTEAELEALGRAVSDLDLYLLSDEIYEHIVFDGFRCRSPGSFAGLRDRTATVNGFSKAYAMQGLRLGFVGAPAPWTRAMTAIQSHAAHHPSTLSQHAALGCLAAAKSILPAARKHYQEARDLTVSRLRALEGDFPFLAPQGAFYVFLSVRSALAAAENRRGASLGSLDLAEFLLEKWDLAVVPGIGFGQEGFLRLSFANPLNSLEMALDRLARGLAAFASA